MAKKKESLSTTLPSAKYVFKSSYYLENIDWDANLKVDFDSHKNPFDIRMTARRIKAILMTFHTVATVKVYVTGRGHHLRVWLRDLFRYNKKIKLTASRILDFQEFLDDDKQRAKFNRARVRRGEPYWNVLWNAKFKNGKLLSAEEYSEDLTSQLKDLIFDLDSAKMKNVR